jgi:hypothetical protein
MTRPDDYGIVAEAIRELDRVAGRDWDSECCVKALAALERLAETDHDEPCLCRYQYPNQKLIYVCDGCAAFRRDCLLKVRG